MDFWKKKKKKKKKKDLEAMKSECWNGQTLSGNKQLHDKWWATVSGPLQACLSWINLDCLYPNLRPNC